MEIKVEATLGQDLTHLSFQIVKEEGLRNFPRKEKPTKAAVNVIQRGSRTTLG